MEKVRSLWVLIGCMLCCLFSYAQEADGTHQAQALKYNPAFDGVGPKVYILPPPKTERELLEESYLKKWQSLSQVEDSIEHIQIGNQLKCLPDPVRPINIRAVDWEVFPAKQRLELAREYYEKHTDRNVLAHIQNNLGNYYFLEGDLLSADSLYKKSLAYAIQQRLDTEGLLVLENLTLLKLKQQDYETALGYFQQMLDRPGLGRDMDHQAMLFLEVAKVEAAMGHYAAAQRIGLNKSITIFKRTDNYKGIVRALNVLASFMETQEKYVEAKWYYLQAIEVAEDHGDKAGLACSLYNLATLKNTISDYTLAVGDFKQAGEIADELSMKILLLKIKNGLGDSYLQLGDYTAANVLLQEYNIIKTDVLGQVSRVN